MILSLHAVNEMRSSFITKEEVKVCLEHGSLEIRQIVGNETRYGKKY